MHSRALLTVLAQLLAVALSLVAAQPARSQQRAPAATPPLTVDVGGRPIQLIIPAGQCQLDRRQPFDAQILDLATRAIAGLNEMLVHTADCAGLDATRTGRTQYLDDFAQVQVGLRFKQVELRGQETASAREICQSMRVDGDKIEKEAGKEIRDRVANLQAGIAVNETKALGVLGQDEHACYSGILINLQTPSGDKRVVLGVFSMAVLNGRLIFMYRYNANPAAGAVDRLLEIQKQAVRDHVALNNRRP